MVILLLEHLKSRVYLREIGVHRSRYVKVGIFQLKRKRNKSHYRKHFLSDISDNDYYVNTCFL